MRDFLTRIMAILVALVLVIVFGLLALRHWAWLILFVPSLGVLALGLYDFFQRRSVLKRNFPVLARIRWLAHDLRPYLRKYIVEGDLEGTPYNFDTRQLVFARAHGGNDKHPFGTERRTDEEGYNWLSHSMAPTESPEHDPRVSIGSDKTYSASVLNVSAMSFGSLSANAVEALNLGAKEGGFFHNTGEGGISRYHRKHGGDLVWEIGSGYFGCRDDEGNFAPDLFKEEARTDAVKMIEIKLSQGAKPGHGGMLPAAKVTAEIAETRKVPEGEDCVSPRSHSAFSTPIGMMEFVARLRELSGGKPVGIKFCVGQPHEVMALAKAMRETDITPDFITIDGGEGGTGAAPLELSDWVGWPLEDGLILVQNVLVGAGLRDRVRLAASGKVASGMDIARAMAMGADWCNAARAFMFSVGCVQSERCHLGTCPTGVTAQDAFRQRGLVPEVQGKRAARYHATTVKSLVDIVAAAGLHHPRELRPNHVMLRTGPNRAVRLDRHHTFLEDGALLDAPHSTPLAEWWDLARADTFGPAGVQM